MSARNLLSIVLLASTILKAQSSTAVCGIVGERAQEYALQVSVKECNGTSSIEGAGVYGVVHFVPPGYDRSQIPETPTALVVTDVPPVLQPFPYFHVPIDGNSKQWHINFETNFRLGIPLGSEVVINFFSCTGITCTTFLGNATTTLPIESYDYDPEKYGCKGRRGEDFPFIAYNATGDEVIRCSTALRYFAIQCAPGEFATVVEGYCKPAPIGSAGDGLSSTLCPIGFFGNETGLEKCHECEPGTFQESKGQSSCSSCPAGSFQSKQGQAFCTSCSSLTCGEGEYRANCGNDSQGTCVLCSSNVLESANLPECQVVVPINYGMVAGIVVGSLAFVSLIIAPLYYKRRERIRRELKEKERAIRELEAERQLQGNLGANVNPLLRQSGVDTEELEKLNAEQAEKLGEMSKELRTLKQERQVEQSNTATARFSGQRNKKEFQIVVEKHEDD